MIKKEIIEKYSEAFKLASNNTNERVGKIREFINSLEGEDEFQEIKKLESQWIKLTKADPEQINEIKRRSMNNPLESFRLMVLSGYYPPPEILIAITNCFTHYLIMHGEVSLDEAFFSKKHVYRTSASYLRNKENKYSLFKYIFIEKNDIPAHLENASLTECAICFLNSIYGESGWGDKLDVESFLRGFRRWRNENPD